MKIIIEGAGQVGTHLAKMLSADGGDVTIIDDDAERIRILSTSADVTTLQGPSSSISLLKEAGCDHADLFIAVNPFKNQSVNIVSALLAKKLGAKRVIARIDDEDYLFPENKLLFKDMGLDLVFYPEKSASDEILQLLSHTAANDSLDFARGKLQLAVFKLEEDSPLLGQRLMDLRGRFKAKFLVCVVQRGSEVIIPRGDFRLQAGDRIGLTADRTELWKLLKATGLAKRQARNVTLMGGSRIAFYLAKMLLSSGTNVTLIESDRAMCHRFSDLLAGIRVYCGDGTQQELLREAGLLDQNAFVTLTGLDEQNILVAYYAKSQQVGQVIAKVNRDEMARMAEQMGLESVISPKDVVVNVVLRYARALQSSMGSSIENLYQLMEGRAEALEFIVQGEAPYTGIPLKDLRMKKNILVAGILRDRRAITPAGDDMILPGDRVVVIAGQHRLNALAEILY